MCTQRLAGDCRVMSACRGAFQQAIVGFVPVGTAHARAAQALEFRAFDADFHRFWPSFRSIRFCRRFDRFVECEDAYAIDNRKIKA